jgi:hypothetical protein
VYISKKITNMPLELNGKLFTITDETTLRKYQREMVFTVSKQFVKINHDPEKRPVETAPIHIPTSYNFYIMENGVRISQGVLRYYEAHSTYIDNGRVLDNWTPQYIAIGHTGVMKSSNTDLNFFLDNCPWNEKVKNDSFHPNYIATSEMMIRTFSRAERASKELSTQKLSNELSTMLLDELVFPIDRMKGLAKIVANQAISRKIAHRLFDIETIEEVALRAELVRLCNTYTMAMNDIIKMDSTDMAEEIEKWRSYKVIELTADSNWVFNETEKTRKTLCYVPNNADPMKTLLLHFQDAEMHYKWYKAINERYKYVLRRVARETKKQEQEQES